MIGLDAYTLDFVNQNLEKLPTMRRLLENYGARPLTGPGAFMSAGVWATFAAAKQPGEHGHYYPFQWRPEKMGFRRSSVTPIPDDVDFDPFWRKIARKGKRVIAFDIGVPLDPVGAPCVEIYNWSNQSNGAALSSDPALLREMRRRFGRRPIGKEVPVPKKIERSRYIRDSMIAAIDAKMNALSYLSSARPWDLLLVGFYEVHRAGHNLMFIEDDIGTEVDPEALLDVYAAQDRALGKLIDTFDDGRTTFGVFSLHSIEPNRAQSHFMRPALSRLNACWLNETRGADAPPARTNLMARLRKAVPADVQYTLAHLLGEHVQDWVVERSVVGGLDWGRTFAFYHPSGGECFIRLNIKGRERHGTLNPDDGEVGRFTSWLRARLLELKTVPEGRPLFSRIVDLHALYPGARSHHLPDLVAVSDIEAPAYRISSPLIGEIHSVLETGRGGNHHAGSAFLVAFGPHAHCSAGVRDIADLGGFADEVLFGRKLSLETPTYEPMFV
jgi:predicted AlkP superfamily phosphohydrolase/phosphomutase